ncbi:hypothetical protein DUNSADRAFT_7026 [Dunaliella salina]|uniref:Encoded protein n=1 Tax=Dunaliella salina TaxID=3046 RepID=A0ABQ7GM81_DUNSA|nr:hypothetical protein DUNSADRAFT_7026 [Dunaliella salina]|eukprot:KAF5835666.1 hypothetical protein DUNSADRAFT_7026 [Dunaliella salina]
MFSSDLQILSRCLYCNSPLPKGLFVFCCCWCQRCFHRERGSVPRGDDKRAFKELLREQKQLLDEHERKVRLGKLPDEHLLQAS